MEVLNAILVKKRIILGLAQSLGKDIYQFMLSSNKRWLNIPGHHLVMNKKAINLNMFDSFMKDGIASDMLGNLTITVKLQGVVHYVRHQD